MFVDGSAGNDAEASVNHWGLVKDDEVQIVGDESVDVDADEGLVYGEPIGQIGYGDPLRFFAERLDFFDSDFGDCRHRDFNRAFLVVFAVLGSIDLVIKDRVFEGTV